MRAEWFGRCARYHHPANDLAPRNWRVGAALGISPGDDEALRDRDNPMRREPAVMTIENDLPEVQIGGQTTLDGKEIAGPDSG